MAHTALETAVSKIEKEYGQNAIMLMGSHSATVKVPSISTGLLSLDMALGCGGFPKGRISEIYGKEGSSKTTIALHAAAECQKAGGVVAYIDAEHALDPSYAQTIGVNLDDLLISQPDTGEQGLDIVEILTESGGVGLIIVDSVAALVPKAELDGSIGESFMGLHARMMGQAMRKLTGKLARSKTCLLFINQTRATMGTSFHGNAPPPDTTTGGRALKFFASVRMELTYIGKIEDGEKNELGRKIRAKIVKNKLAPPFRVVEYDLYYGRGVSREADLIDMAVDSGLIQKKGAFYSMGEERIGQGKQAVIDHLRLNPDIVTYLHGRIVNGAA